MPRARDPQVSPRHERASLGLEVRDLRLELEAEHLAADTEIGRGERPGLGRGATCPGMR